MRKPVLDLEDGDWQDTLSLNLSSAYWLGRAVGRLMVEQRYSRVVLVSSVSGLLAHPHHAPYAATNRGISRLLRVMAREWAPYGVTVNAVAPGYIETDLTKAYLEATTTGRAWNRSSRRSGSAGPRRSPTPSRSGLDRARFITGQVLYVDGGRILV